MAAAGKATADLSVKSRVDVEDEEEEEAEEEEADDAGEEAGSQAVAATSTQSELLPPFLPYLLLPQLRLSGASHEAPERSSGVVL